MRPPSAVHHNPAALSQKEKSPQVLDTLDTDTLTLFQLGNSAGR